MTDVDSATEHLSAAMTTTTMTSSSRGTEFYFQCAVVVIGVVGAGANGLILYALVVSKQYKSHVLIVNQNALDCLSCLCLVLTYSLKLSRLQLTGKLGHWLCTLLLSEAIGSVATVASILNLAVITVERYLKVVHPTWSKTKLRPSMIYSAMVFVCIVSLVYNLALVIPTSVVIDGVCYAYAVWKNKADSLGWLSWHFVSFYVIILVIFVLCYWRIALVIRRQAGVMAGHNDAGSIAAHIHLNQTQTNVVKTMVKTTWSRQRVQDHGQDNMVKTMITMVKPTWSRLWSS